MRFIKNSGLGLFLLALVVFNALTFLGEFEVTRKALEDFISEKQIKSEYFEEHAEERLLGKTFTNSWSLSTEILSIAEESHNYHREKIKSFEEAGLSQDTINKEWSKVLWLKSTKKHGDYAYPLVLKSAKGFVVDHKLLLFVLTFIVGMIGGLLYFLPDIKLKGSPGIKNNGIFQNAVSNKGWVAWLVFAYLISFYITLYFVPDLLVNQIKIADPISQVLNGGEASQWFLYGLLYCSFMTVMGIRMIIKYRHNRYQIVRTISVMFFQLTFAFLIPELLVKFNQPWYDFKSAWPLDYSFFFDWNVDKLINGGNLGMFMLFWGVLMTLIIVPVMVYFYGKRWYCSWVCGCGGLAETVGDPYRQHSDKSIKAWKFERYIIHIVLLFAIFMTVGVLWGGEYFLGMKVYDIQFWYGFLIGSIFSGVIGTGFYPILGNRVWCRFGCPLAAYMGIVQRFKSRFRITTNGGQCISCGNCSTYCEQGIDVRAYAQKGQNIVRSSCVGCGVCSAVCPRGVLKLENGPEKDRVNEAKPLSFKNGKIDLNL